MKTLQESEKILCGSRLKWRVFIGMTVLSLLTSSLGWAKDIQLSWNNYMTPFTKDIRVLQYGSYAIEKVDVSVSLPREFLDKHKEIVLVVDIGSRTMHNNEAGFHMFSPIIRVNNAIIKRYKIPVRETPARQSREVKIQRKNLEPGKNTLQFSFKWHQNNWSCSSKGCGYEITRMYFKHALKPTPTPTRKPTPRPRKTATPRPTATPTPSPITGLLEKADEYFEKKWYLTPKETNAFDTYKEVLKISTSNMHAREKLYDIMKSYKSWGDNNYKEGDYEKAKSYYTRYMVVAEYVKDELHVGTFDREVDSISERLELLENPPTPTPTPEPIVDEFPMIEILTEFPEKTEAEELSIQGLVKDDLGVAEIHFMLNGESSETLQFSEEESRVEQPFEKTFLLAPGENRITIEAVDTKKQSMKQEVRLIRTALPETTPLPPTPTPTLIDEYPEIDVLSDIPAETTEAYLTLKGTLKDDRGIEDFKISIRRPDTTWFEVLRNVEFDGEHFSADLRLEIGETGIMLVATDTLGQLAKEEFTLTREQRSASGIQNDTESGSEDKEQNGEEKSPAIKHYVILIGAEEYLDERIPPYQCAEQDIQKIYEFFIDPDRGNLPEEQIKLLTGKDVTERNLKKTFGKWLREQETENSNILLYFIGYGGYEHGHAYWLSYDTEPDDIFSTSLSLKKIDKALSRIQARSSIIFIDAVFLGEKVADTTEPLWDELAAEQRIIVGASDGKTAHICTAEQQSGLFTSSFLQGLEGAADLSNDGEIHTKEFWDFLNQQQAGFDENPEVPFRPTLLGELFDELLLQLPDRQASEEQSTLNRQSAKDRIIEVYRNGHLSADQFKRALEILKTGEKDQILEDFLHGNIPLEIFKETF